MKTLRPLYLLPVVIIVVVLAAGCDSLPAIGGQPDPTAAPIVDTGPQTVSVTGEVVPTQDTTLSFLTGGQMVDLLVEVGDQVADGAEIGVIHANDKDKLFQAREEILAAITIGDTPVERLPQFYGVIQ